MTVLIEFLRGKPRASIADDVPAFVPPSYGVFDFNPVRCHASQDGMSIFSIEANHVVQCICRYIDLKFRFIVAYCNLDFMVDVIIRLRFFDFQRHCGSFNLAKLTAHTRQTEGQFYPIRARRQQLLPLNY